MKRTKIDGYTLVEMTEEEVMLEFGYDFSLVPGAVKEFSIEEADGELLAYETSNGNYILWRSGRATSKFVDSKEDAIKELIKDAYEIDCL